MKAFRRLIFTTLVAVYLLILVGGVVRSTGSGMGCPDWPKCFGKLVPPTDVSELPADYQTVYSEYRQKKNEKFARYLRVIGMNTTADALLSDPSVKVEGVFNPTKTWIEYLNRLLGVVIGLLVLATFIYSFRYRFGDRSIFLLALAILLLTIFQGWIGSFVVSSNLTPWTVSIHMFLALLIVALLILLWDRSGLRSEQISKRGFWLFFAALTTIFIQIFLGTQLREVLDVLATKFDRNAWIENAGTRFIIHRTFSWVVLILQVWCGLFIYKTTTDRFFGIFTICVILATVLSGVGMAYLGVPPWLQPTHLLLATISFGLLFSFWLRVNRKPYTGKAN